MATSGHFFFLPTFSRPTKIYIHTFPFCNQSINVIFIQCACWVLTNCSHTQCGKRNHSQAEQQQWQQNSRFQTDGFFFFFRKAVAVLLSAILLRRIEQRNKRPPRSVDPLACDNLKFSRMELSSRLPVRPVVSRRKSSLLDKAATMASSKTSFKLRWVNAEDSTYVRAPSRSASRIASSSPTGFSPYLASSINTCAQCGNIRFFCQLPIKFREKTFYFDIWS